ncbi:hypothetical protein [Paenibacillus thalictri]|uniref:Uncharacterized protein n=1 Tax=Paenibacillus thalictri TaxID=2527873 RepID=A0A4Q9DUR0_9BACL|nr:hypothetical protein [Paenibacillus thalictri]TBL78520.1 hypothetical protein EYB31_13515 [Paenibacillus thalictri]
MFPAYFWKLLRYSFFLGAVPIIVLGFFSYYKASDALQKKSERRESSGFVANADVDRAAVIYG